ncbi:MAG: YIP1 family protein [Nitrospinae bacterium]|nr:YIP1 family protein [Nitrospinota bacterium]MEC4671564.1 YIP1 family protein [Nitrospirota bacterium]
MTPFIDRMIRAAKLDINLYEEVEADESALGQATGVVVLSSVASGVGLIETGGVAGVVVGTIMALVGWYVWAFLTYYIGTRLLPEPQTRASHGELLRTIGFSSSPGLIRVFAIVPSLHNMVFLIAGIWMLVAMVIAVRQALDYHSTLRAVGVCLIGWVVQAVILVLVLTMFGGLPEPMLEQEPF